MNKLKLELILLGILIFGFLPVIFYLYEASISLNKYLNRENYKDGLLIVEDVECGSGYNGQDANCYGFGSINGIIKTKILIGQTPGLKVLFAEKTDFEKKEYQVFYREDGKYTILKEKHETKFNGRKYLEETIFYFFYPLIIYPAIVLHYRRVKKKNNLKNKVWERE